MSEELTTREELELRRLRDKQNHGISWQSQPQIPGHQTVAMNAVGVGPEIPDLRRPLLQSQKCSHGEHERAEHQAIILEFEKILRCKYCRCLYAEEP